MIINAFFEKVSFNTFCKGAVSKAKNLLFLCGLLLLFLPLKKQK